MAIYSICKLALTNMVSSMITSYFPSVKQVTLRQKTKLVEACSDNFSIMDSFSGWQRNSASSNNFGLSACPNMLYPQQLGPVCDSQVETFLFPNLQTRSEARAHATNPAWNVYGSSVQPQPLSVPDGQRTVADDEIMEFFPSTTNMRKGKRGSSSKQARPTKAKKVKRESDDDEEDADGSVKDRWTDEQVGHLIAFRVELESEFEKSGGKQGKDTWSTLHKKMVVVVPGFKKSAEACRRKWTEEYNKYKIDKRHNGASGNDRKVTCRFYEQIDEAYSNRANVKKLIHADASDSPNPAPLDMENTSAEPENGASALPSGLTSQGMSASSTMPKREKNTSGVDKICECLQDMAANGRELTAAVRETKQYLASFDTLFAALLQKL